MRSLTYGLAIACLLTAPLMTETQAQVTVPDTTCANQVGVGPGDIPHAYSSSNGLEAYPGDACPDHFSGELGFGVGGAWLFSRVGIGVDPDGNAGQGSGVDNCYGSGVATDGVPTGHHGTSTTIHVRDSVLPNGVGFTVASDWNRSSSNPMLPAGNADNANHAACGDNLVEPCTAAEEAATPSMDFLSGCNHLDQSEVAVDSWMVPNGGTLGSWAGADGAVAVFVDRTSLSANGAVWTDSSGGGTGVVQTSGASDSGLVASMVFPSGGGAPTVMTGAGWTCTPAFPDGVFWGVDCQPLVNLQARTSAKLVCWNPVGIAGATPVSSGWANVRIGCHVNGGGTLWSDCGSGVTWSLVGGACVGRIPGRYDMLMCRAQVVWSGTATGFAMCFNMS